MTTEAQVLLPFSTFGSCDTSSGETPALRVVPKPRRHLQEATHAIDPKVYRIFSTLLQEVRTPPTPARRFQTEAWRAADTALSDVAPLLHDRSKTTAATTESEGHSQEFSEKITWCINTVRHSTRPADRSLAAEFIGKHTWGRKEVETILLEALKDPSPLVGEGAIYGLSHYLRRDRSEAIVGALSEVASNEGSPLRLLAQEILELHED